MIVIFSLFEISFLYLHHAVGLSGQNLYCPWSDSLLPWIQWQFGNSITILQFINYRISKSISPNNIVCLSSDLKIFFTFLNIYKSTTHSLLNVLLLSQQHNSLNIFLKSIAYLMEWRWGPHLKHMFFILIPQVLRIVETSQQQPPFPMILLLFMSLAPTDYSPFPNYPFFTFKLMFTFKVHNQVLLLYLQQ